MVHTTSSRAVYSVCNSILLQPYIFYYALLQTHVSMTLYMYPMASRPRLQPPAKLPPYLRLPDRLLSKQRWLSRRPCLLFPRPEVAGALFGNINRSLSLSVVCLSRVYTYSSNPIHENLKFLSPQTPNIYACAGSRSYYIRPHIYMHGAVVILLERGKQWLIRL